MLNAAIHGARSCRRRTYARRLTRRRLLAVTGGVAFLAACGQGEEQATVPASEPTERIVKHALGETNAPVNPQRVVTLDNFSLEACLAVGVTPIGASFPGDVADRPFLTGKLERVENIGSTGEPSLERVLTLKPDLILGLGPTHKDLYPQLSEIAPTVLAPFQSSSDWKAVFAKNAEALGRTTEAGQAMDRFDGRVAELQAKLGERRATTTVSVLRAYPDYLALYLSNTFIGTIIDDVGLLRPPSQRTAGGQGRISREQIRDADADVLFLWGYGASAQIAENAEAARERLKADPLWSQLSAVQRGQAYEVPGYWIGSGILAANAVLDDLFKYLT